MNRDDIMALANQTAGQHWMDEAHVIRFAALVAAAEREACATFLEHGVDLGGLAEHTRWQKYTADLLAGCAAAIRARGQV